LRSHIAVVIQVDVFPTNISDLSRTTGMYVVCSKNFLAYCFQSWFCRFTSYLWNDPRTPLTAGLCYAVVTTTIRLRFDTEW